MIVNQGRRASVRGRRRRSSSKGALPPTLVVPTAVGSAIGIRFVCSSKMGEEFERVLKFKRYI